VVLKAAMSCCIKKLMEHCESSIEGVEGLAGLPGLEREAEEIG